MSVVIRRGTRADVDPIMKIVGDVVPLMIASGNGQWAEDYPTASHFELDVENDELWVAVLVKNDELTNKSSGEGGVGDIVVGFAAITTEQPEEYQGVGGKWDRADTAVVVHRCAVAPHCRGKGVAVKLYEQAVAVATEEKGLNLLRVDTNSENPAMQGVIVKSGYTYVGDLAFNNRPGLSFRCYERYI